MLLSFTLGGTFSVGTSPQAILAADVNHDGHADLVVANSGSNTVSVLLGKGNGTFKAAHNFATGTSPTGVAAADLDGDGRPDLAVANQSDNTASVLLNATAAGATTAAFAAQQTFATGTSPTGQLVEVIKLRGHPWFLAVQCHPKFKSKPTEAHPLFRGFIEASLARHEKKGEGLRARAGAPALKV